MIDSAPPDRWQELTATIDGHSCSWRVAGPLVGGGEAPLIAGDDDLLCEGPAAVDGFTVIDVLGAEALAALRHRVERILDHLLDGIEPGLRLSSLERYHDDVTAPAHDRLHRETGGYLPLELLDGAVDAVGAAAQRRIGVPLRPFTFDELPPSFGLRIVRPASGDHNPPHRDAWIDRLRHSATIYLPLAGSTQASSLPVVAGSHRWPESATLRTVSGAVTPHRTFTVPACAPPTGPLAMTRPEVRPGQAMLFSPYLIHGGAANLGRDTRVSLELRFLRRT